MEVELFYNGGRLHLEIRTGGGALSYCLSGRRGALSPVPLPLDPGELLKEWDAGPGDADSCSLPDELLTPRTLKRLLPEPAGPERGRRERESPPELSREAWALLGRLGDSSEP